MAELIPKERLQPSLLDRLTDDEPDQKEESREKRVLSPRQLRKSVIRDLQWLLNSTDLASVQDLSAHPQVIDSVLNYGLPDLAGKNVSALSAEDLERDLRRTILRFEPRILPQSLKIRAVVDEGRMSQNAILFDIEGELWGQPAPQQLYLKTEVDLESGAFEVSEGGMPSDPVRIMDPRHLDYYNRELQHIREIGGEFAAEFPKIAGRLGLSGFECADPYVERLLEGFAYLAARVQLKIDSELPVFTQHLLEIAYPHYLAPTPSMAVVQLQPDLTEGALVEGYVLPRDTVLRSDIGKGEQTACEYRTAHETTLWPLELTEAEYFVHAGPVVKTDLSVLQRSKAGIRLRLRCSAGLNLDALTLDRLVLFLRGADELPFRLYELLLAKPVAVLVQPVERPLPWCDLLGPSSLVPKGFGDDDALLPYAPPSFQGYRNLQEYFAFPERFLFVELRGLSRSLRRAPSSEIDIIVLLPRREPSLEKGLDASNFLLFCTPAVNLFPKRCDRIHLTDSVFEHHLVPDRTRPMDFEVYQVDSVTGYGSANQEPQEFLPFYAAHDLSSHADRPAYYSLHRAPRRLSSRQRRKGPRSSYIGSEVFVNLVDAAQAPYRSDLRQLAVTTLCTNRDLPLQMPVDIGKSDFTLEQGAPVEATRIVAGPTKPQPSHAHGDTAWRLISHLSLNYLSIVDGSGKGAAALRELLSLYGDVADPAIHKQIEGVRSVSSRPVTRRLPDVRPVTYARGLEIVLSCDETAFEGAGVFLLGSVLERFFARYVSINSFTEMVLTTDRGEVMRWPATIGRRQIL